MKNKNTLTLHITRFYKIFTQKLIYFYTKVCLIRTSVRLIRQYLWLIERRYVCFYTTLLHMLVSLACSIVCTCILYVGTRWNGTTRRFWNLRKTKAAQTSTTKREHIILRQWPKKLRKVVNQNLQGSRSHPTPRMIRVRNMTHTVAVAVPTQMMRSSRNGGRRKVSFKTQQQQHHQHHRKNRLTYCTSLLLYLVLPSQKGGGEKTVSITRFFVFVCPLFCLN